MRRKGEATMTRSVPIFTILLLLSGCGFAYAPKNPSPIMFYPSPLPAADRAVEAARKSASAAQCPQVYQEAARLRDAAYTTYWACRTAEAIDLANQAVAKVNAGCPVAAAPPAPALPPAPAPPPPAAPTAMITANPASIQEGQCTTLTWSATNSTSATVDPGLVGVGTSGSRQVCPSAATEYTIVARGAGGSANASTKVTVTAPPPQPAALPAPKVIDRMTLRINFDTDKADIRPADEPELQKAVEFIKKHPQAKVSVEGHTDSTASDTYNQRLSERRADAVKGYLVNAGATDGRVTTAGHGEKQPIADNATKDGRFQNRRVEMLIVEE